MKNLTWSIKTQVNNLKIVYEIYTKLVAHHEMKQKCLSALNKDFRINITAYHDQVLVYCVLYLLYYNPTQCVSYVLTSFMQENKIVAH